MEVIKLPGYTEEEKVKIAERHLIPKQIKEHGLKQANLQISENATREIVREYTREAGVRNLEREIAAICRKTARVVVDDRKYQARVSAASLAAYLGIPRYHWGTIEKENEVGVATGLAWTEVGGDVLSVEVSILKGKGNIILTGKLGDVMKESAQAALSYVRSRAQELSIPEDFHEKYDLHIHIPEGAIPKDGPSAGITIASAIASALSGRRTSRELAMTGEITLRGRVLPVGCIKEKVLAAHRVGIKKLIIPKENKKDLEEIPSNVRRKITFVLVENMDEVLREALLPLNDDKEGSEAI
jgi:ATP-dependent Lon protease